MPDGREYYMNGGGERAELQIRNRILYQQSVKDAAAKAEAAELLRVANLSPEERAREIAVAAHKKAVAQAEAERIRLYVAAYANGKLNRWGYIEANPGLLTPIEKTIQQVITADEIDYDMLFKLVPLKSWEPNWMLQKYRFKDEADGKRRYFPWTEQNIADFVYSAYYTVQPGYTCPPDQLDGGFAHHWGKQQGTAAKYPDPYWFGHVWTILPGGGAAGTKQQYGCEKYRPSLWVKIRKFVYLAVAIVAAVYLGPIVLEKIAGMMANAMSSVTGGAIGGGTGAAGGGVTSGVATATKTSAFISKVNSAVSVYNKINTVAHIVQGKIPPIPVGITGGTFKAVAMNAVKQEIKKAAIDAAMEAGIKYVQKKMTAKEEAKIKAEISALQRKMDALVPKGTPIMPSPLLPPEDRKAIAEIQVVQAEREKDNTALIALAAGASLFLVAGG